MTSTKFVIVDADGDNIIDLVDEDGFLIEGGLQFKTLEEAEWALGQCQNSRPEEKLSIKEVFNHD